MHPCTKPIKKSWGVAPGGDSVIVVAEVVVVVVVVVGGGGGGCFVLFVKRGFWVAWTRCEEEARKTVVEPCPRSS